ncbi:MAG: GH36-type glycosyl hydrolase domain-containing protein [Lachnospiraceae bacterium]|jgi:cellobiose phosphorylase
MSESRLPYTFDDEKRQIVFHRQNLPAPWINYLSNGRMHAFVSQAGGGMCWWRSTQKYRLTRYRFYNLPIDSPGFYVYLRMSDGSVWSPTFRPCGTGADFCESAHSAGYSVFTARKDGLTAVLTLFMAPDYDTLVWDLCLRNENSAAAECDVFAYVEFSQLDYPREVNLGYYLKWNVDVHYDEQTDAVLYLYSSWLDVDENRLPLVYFASGEKPDSFCCSRDLFCGNYRDERDPAGVEQGKLGNQNLKGGEPCGALQHHVKLGPGAEKRMEYFLGAVPGVLADREKTHSSVGRILTELRNKDSVTDQFRKNLGWWERQLGVYQCGIPDEAARREINLWNPVQSVATARFSRSISSSASGIRGVGFRDTAQDMLAQAYRRPDWAAEALCRLASMQFEDGRAVHTFWPEENRLPDPVTRSDDHLWLIYLAAAIIAETGDDSLLDRQVPFLGEDLKTPTKPASLWEHLLRAAQFTETHLGAHGLPLILFSDWNDHIGPFGRRGKGETVFAAEQYVIALNRLCGMAEGRGEHELAGTMREKMRRQAEALEKYAWDGRWYLRGFDDDGKPIGSHDARYAKIWVNTQSWMIMAGCGREDRNIAAMDSVRQYLDTGMGLLINYPSFQSEDGSANRLVNNLPAGYSENGGIFCQANCWAIIAEALLGRGDLAWKYYKQIMPDEVIRRIGVDCYRGEAYAYSSTMLGPDNEQFGQACVSQVTGTAAWMDIASTQYLLGIRPTLQGLLIDPSIPRDWEGYRVSRMYRGCRLDIQVSDPAHAGHGVRKISVGGVPVEGNLIPPEMVKDRKRLEIQVTLG